jgi:hypothetical protein
LNGVEEKYTQEFAGTLKEYRPLIRPRPQYEDNIKVNVK